ncbi:MFS transporter [Allokutzneria sp. NRRL B-24872]|uniref:MFS transporter n=1 Tax=Allokutzneria sp. NRRL B-24872 TaxID=1137961 RepID=UPI000A37B1AE|nr:MFS transporter [Allokutzneria sp. NRRL B-24872]
MTSATSSLRGHRDFRQLWIGDTVAQFGTSVGGTALPLLAVTALAVGPFEMGLLTAAKSLACLLIGLPAGVWVDRMRRRPLMLGADLGRAALLATVPLAWWAGSLTLAHLLVVSLLVGALTVFFDVAYQAYLPGLVGREHLVEGNAKLQASMSVAEVSGPALSGWLVQAVGGANAMLTTAGGYLASAVFLRRIRTVEPEPERAAERRLLPEMAEGLRFVLGNPLLRAIVSCTATWNLFSSAGMAVLLLFLTRDLALPPALVGVVLACFGVGGVLGALTARRWGTRFGQARTIWLSMVVTQPLALLAPLAWPGAGAVLVMIAWFALGYGAIVYNVAQVSFRQAICPDRLLGRMNASVRFVVFGTQPLGALAGGAVGEVIGVRPTLWITATGMALAVSWVLASPLRRMRDLPVSAR